MHTPGAEDQNTSRPTLYIYFHDTLYRYKKNAQNKIQEKKCWNVDERRGHGEREGKERERERRGREGKERERERHSSHTWLSLVDSRYGQCGLEETLHFTVQKGIFLKTLLPTERSFLVISHTEVHKKPAMEK